MGVGASDAEALVLRFDDLPGGGWLELPQGGAPGEPTIGDVVMASCLAENFPEDAVTATAESPRFLRAPATLVFSTSVVLAGEADADDAFHAVSSGEFAACFADAIAADLDLEPGGGVTYMGSATRVLEDSAAGTGVPAPRRAVHRATFTGATPDRLVPVHLDAAVLSHSDAVVFVWFADTPEPVPEDLRQHVLERVAERL